MWKSRQQLESFGEDISKRRWWLTQTVRREVDGFGTPLGGRKNTDAWLLNKCECVRSGCWWRGGQEWHLVWATQGRKGSTPGCTGEDNPRHQWVPKVEFWQYRHKWSCQKRDILETNTKKSMLASDFKEKYKKDKKEIFYVLNII